MSSSSYTGSCFCGQVRFDLTGKPTFACHCHCRSCQRASGAPFVTWATFALDDLNIRSGTIAENRSSDGVQRGHCAACGSTLTYENDRRPGEIDFAVTCFDDLSGIAPQAHIWVEDKASWLVIDDDLPKYETTVSG